MFEEIDWCGWSVHHIARHGVAPHEVEEALFSRPRWRTPGRDDTLLVFGTAADGRHLTLILADRGGGRAYVVTARDMTEKEKKTFKRKAK